MTLVSPVALRDGICEALWEYVNARDLADVCVHLGLEPQGEGEDPFHSKRGYVRHRLVTKSLDEMVDLARKVVAQFGAPELAAVLERLGAHWYMTGHWRSTG